MNSRLLALALTVTLGLILLATGAAVFAADKINGPAKGSDPVERGVCKPAPANYSEQQARDWAKAHSAASGGGYKYVFIPPQEAKDAKQAALLRVAVLKAWNHLSWRAELDLGVDASEGHCLVWALSPKFLFGAKAEEKWRAIASGAKKVDMTAAFEAPTGALKPFDAEQPVDAPRFVFNATHGNAYTTVHETPCEFKLDIGLCKQPVKTFEERFRLREADRKGKAKIVATSIHRNAIVCSTRITAWRKIEIEGKERFYVFSNDKFQNRDERGWKSGGAAVPARYRSRAPTDEDVREISSATLQWDSPDESVAAEWWMQLPNGFVYYGIHGEASQERHRGEWTFAIDPANWAQGDELVVARSCITCHPSGAQSAPSDNDMQGKNGWTSNEDLEKLYYKPVRDEFHAAMRKIVAAAGSGDKDFDESLVQGTREPVGRAIMLIEGPYPGKRVGDSKCRYHCNGKFMQDAANGPGMCETLPLR